MTTKEHLSKHDREIAAIRKLILTGMKMLNHNQQQINQNQRQLNQLTQEVRELTAHMRRGATNGHTKRKVDLQ